MDRVPFAQLMETQIHTISGIIDSGMPKSVTLSFSTASAHLLRVSRCLLVSPQVHGRLPPYHG